MRGNGRGSTSAGFGSHRCHAAGRERWGIVPWSAFVICSLPLFASDMVYVLFTDRPFFTDSAFVKHALTAWLHESLGTWGFVVVSSGAGFLFFYGGPLQVVPKS